MTESKRKGEDRGSAPSNWGLWIRQRREGRKKDSDGSCGGASRHFFFYTLSTELRRTLGGIVIRRVCLFVGSFDESSVLSSRSL